MHWFWHRQSADDKAFYDFFRNVLGFRPRNVQLYRTAFRHRSCSQGSACGVKLNNERLEFLGDAVLSSIVADYLYRMYPQQDEGFLTITRSKIVSRASLGNVARFIGLHEMIEYNRSPHCQFKSLDGDAFEALIGAMYIERGYRFTRRVVLERIICPYVDVETLANEDLNYKGHLIICCQHSHRTLSFKVLRSFVQGHDCRRIYECGAVIDGEVFASAKDYTIKGAEQLAAQKALEKMQADS